MRRFSRTFAAALCLALLSTGCCAIRLKKAASPPSATEVASSFLKSHPSVLEITGVVVKAECLVIEEATEKVSRCPLRSNEGSSSRAYHVLGREGSAEVELKMHRRGGDWTVIDYRIKRLEGSR